MNLLPSNTLDYVIRYGGRCRDCADHFGICPNSGLPCAEPGRAIKWVIDAINYGAGMGFIKPNTSEFSSQMHQTQGDR